MKTQIFYQKYQKISLTAETQTFLIAIFSQFVQFVRKHVLSNTRDISICMCVIEIIILSTVQHSLFFAVSRPNLVSDEKCVTLID